MSVNPPQFRSGEGTIVMTEVLNPASSPPTHTEALAGLHVDENQSQPTEDNELRSEMSRDADQVGVDPQQSTIRAPTGRDVLFHPAPHPLSPLPPPYCSLNSHLHYCFAACPRDYLFASLRHPMLIYHSPQPPAHFSPHTCSPTLPSPPDHGRQRDALVLLLDGRHCQRLEPARPLRHRRSLRIPRPHRLRLLGARLYRPPPLPPPPARHPDRRSAHESRRPRVHAVPGLPRRQ